ncbi:MAG: substrate-binding domain-containing protein [Lachnospiraceae bacterium]|nr:substrate-binding domain-containing protein [Lachnospiraceae bacterium]
MKKFKKITALILSLVMVFSLAPCVSAKGSTKIGVLVSDTTSGEALGFRSYYEDYIEEQYDVTFIYSDELSDAAGEKDAIDTMVAQNCKAIISFSSFDRAAQIEQCEEEGVYYAVATGTLTDEEYETYKEYEYYVGAIGPDNQTEYEAGYNMAKYYLDQGMTNFGIFTGAVPYYTEMHIYRVAGMLAAMVEAGGDDASYNGATDEASIIAQIYADGCSISTGSIGTINLLSVVEGYTMDDAWYASCESAVNVDGLEAFLAVGNGADFFAASKPDSVKIATIDSYVDSLGEAMSAGSVDYLAGKFNSCIGPIFIATMRAIDGDALRTDDGYALALGQGYWVATSYEEFETYQSGDSVESPAYTKDILDQYLDADYSAFADFVAAYTYEDIAAMG